MKTKKNNLAIRRFVSVLLLTVITITSTGFNSLAYCTNQEPIIQYDINYNEDKTKANILFDINSVDQSKYTIIKINSVKDDVILYDKNLADNLLQYEVSENGDCVFSIEYMSTSAENTETETEAQYSTEEIKISINDIVKKEITNNEVIEDTDDTKSNEVTENKTNEIKLLQANETSETRADEYKHQIEIYGQADYAGNAKKIVFTIDPNTYQISPTFVSDYTMHSGYPTEKYVEISVIKKGSTLDDVKKTEVFSALGGNSANGGELGGAYDFSTIESYDFEVGDMLVFRDYKNQAFHITGGNVIGSDGGEGPNYDITNTADEYSTRISDEKVNNSVYEITKNGLKEIYNAAPVISGADEPLYITYGDDDTVDSLLRKGVTATDDRDKNGAYAPNTDYTESIQISGAPVSTTEIGNHIVTYSVKDSWGRITTIERNVVVSSPYPHQISIQGEGMLINQGTNERFGEKIVFSINPDTYDITPTLVHPYPMNSGYGNKEYVSISVIKNGSTLENAEEIKVFSSLGNNTGVPSNSMYYDFGDIMSFDFEEGDMLIFRNYYNPAFHIDGGNVIGSNGGVGPNYDKNNPSGEFAGRIPNEKINNSVYEITANGLKEVYNAAPEIEGTEKPLFIQYGFEGDINELLKKGVSATDDRDATGKYVEDGVDYTDSLNIQAANTIETNKPGFYKVTYSVTDSWGRTTSKERNVVVLSDYNKVTIEGMTFSNDGTVDFDEDVTIDPTNNKITLSNGIELYTKSGSSDVIVKVPYQGKDFSIKNGFNVVLPDQAELSGDHIKVIDIKKDKSATLSTDYRNHADNETSIAIEKDGTIRYPIETYVDKVQFNDGNKYVDIAKTYTDRDLKKYIQSEQPIRISFAIWNPIPVSTNDVSTYLTIQNLSIDGKWMDILSVVGSDNSIFNIPSKGQGELVSQEKWYSIVKANSEKYYINCDVALPANTNLDITKYTDGNLPLVELEANLYDENQQAYGDHIEYTLAVASVPVVEVKNAIWSILENGETLISGYAQSNLGFARTYDDNVLHSLNLANGNNLQIVDEIYKVYDFKSSAWIDTTKNKFEALTKAKDEPTIYSYRFTVKDSRRSGLNYDIDHPLQTSNTSYLFAANKSVSSNDNKMFIMTNGKDVVLSETQIVALNETDIINELFKQTSLKAVQIDGDNIEQLTTEDLNIQFDSSYNKANPKEGTYDVTVSCGSGDSLVTIFLKLNITSNTWSYDTPDRTEENGASGFIVIPKYIELEKVPGENNISQTCEVFFANYSAATEVKYDLSVDNTFEMINEEDPNNKFNVFSSSNEGQINGDKLFVGEINNTNTKCKGKFITFSASSEVVDKTKGRWEGLVTFYFDRK